MEDAALVKDFVKDVGRELGRAVIRTLYFLRTGQLHPELTTPVGVLNPGGKIVVRDEDIQPRQGYTIADLQAWRLEEWKRRGWSITIGDPEDHIIRGEN